ncbi:unnamed protein product [Sphagnum troendelagicum]|uniref:Uncharacterized protein n=1 Tax=Sphagnum troendelagicum TaxID=128251 RepID=A0ABP0UNE3_9BRYO
MAEVVRNLKQFVMICLTLDGATNVQGKQIINLMACGPMAFFLSTELRRESTENLYEKLIDCKRRLLLTICELALGFVSHVVSSNADDDDADPQQVATMNEHFVGAPMFTFCSDSPSVMIKLRHLSVEVLFSVICFYLSYLEGDESTFLSVYTCFLAVAHHFCTLSPDVRAALDLSNADVDKMHTLVCHRLKTIFSLTHALAFCTDPLFDDLHDNLAKLHRDDFLNLGDLTILQQCKKAIKWMAVANILLNRLMQSEFDLYTIHVENDDDDFVDVFSMPQHMWALADDSVYSHLKKPLFAIQNWPFTRCRPRPALVSVITRRPTEYIHAINLDLQRARSRLTRPSFSMRNSLHDTRVSDATASSFDG